MTTTAMVFATKAMIFTTTTMAYHGHGITAAVLAIDNTTTIATAGKELHSPPLSSFISRYGRVPLFSRGAKQATLRDKRSRGVKCSEEDEYALRARLEAQIASKSRKSNKPPPDYSSLVKPQLDVTYLFDLPSQTGRDRMTLARTNDGNEPEYMASNPVAWMKSSKQDCCEANFIWMLNECLGSSSGPTGGATSKWFIDWDDFKCKRDCAVGTGPSCGGRAESWEELFDTRSACCSTKAAWNPTDCHVD
ncbi:hypothetical protein THAOC_28129 [Thalassiosira oceanica]|uniref:Uncharacterized protein n=1 Tax=Thalassiosira oceanica TaxID=159749 RepID=K0RJZ0_THAOC|nr:hypothetical protein THAOC_28129 [Thalassiosira oceanica]|eukprot:EJK52579.1 hypothetical protein THAOC_28129 [Thalassiosira oceanica]